jgi:phosphonate transport system permease protein
VVGLGPFAGILAIASTDTCQAVLGDHRKRGPEARGRRYCRGGGTLSRVRFGLLPEAMPVIASQILYFIESNTCSATIFGIVGAGAIGLYVNESIRTQD